MKKTLLALAPLFSLLLLTLTQNPGRSVTAKVVATPALVPAASSLDRSPTDLAVSADGRFALASNSTSNSVSLVDLVSGKLISEAPVGNRPFAVALSHDDKLSMTTNQFSDSVSFLNVSAEGLKGDGTLEVGSEPRGIAISKDDQYAYIALAGEDAVVKIDIKTRKILKRAEVGVEPWHLGISPDGKHLAVGGVRSQDMTILNPETMAEEYVVKLRGHNVRHVAFSPDSHWAYVPNIAERGRPVTKENIDQGWVVGNRLSRVPLTEEGPREAISLDPQGKAVGDVDGVAVSPNGEVVVVSAAGTHELLVYHLPLPFVAFGGPGDHIESSLLNDRSKFKRIPLGGRPLGATFLADGKSVVVANYLSNSIQVVDIEAEKITKTISLGGPATPALARKGEAIFQDASRSFHEWYSCGTCHVEGHTNGSSFDTFNDGSYGTPKKTLSLRGVSKTGPWTWHGWQKSLRQLAHDSAVKSMQGVEPTEEDLTALTAYLETLDFKPKAHQVKQSEAQRRGELVFNSKGCNTCHAAPYYTSPGIYKVGLEKPEDVYEGYNPPSLLGVGTRSPYLHTSEAYTLESVLSEFHRPSQLTGKPDCTKSEMSDLVAFLNSL